MADTGSGSSATAGALGTGAGTITFSGGTLQYSAASAGTDYSSRIKSSTAGAISVDTNAQNVTYASALANTNTDGLTKLGTGTLVLSAANLYTGTTTVSAGTLQASGAGTFGSVNNGLTVNTGGTADLNGTSQGVGALNGTGGTILNNDTGTNATLTVGNANASGGNYAGVIANNTSGTGTVALTETGTGTQTLSGAEHLHRWHLDHLLGNAPVHQDQRDAGHRHRFAAKVPAAPPWR